MRIALTFAARGTGPAEDLEADTTATVELFAGALAKLGHDVERIDITGSPARVIARLEATPPDLVVNLAEGARGRTRDALFPAIFEELNLPCVGPDTATLCLFAEKLAKGASLEDTMRALVKSACKRFGLAERPDAPRRPKKALRVGLTFNMKREAGDDEAEFDSPKTIAAIAAAIESYGHIVVPLEADADLPMSLAGAHPDVVFNVAEGRRGRGREAQVPALCEMLGIPYTGSDPTTLAICLDKSLAKQILRAAGIDTANWQLLSTGREKLRTFRYPVIVKPNAEGTSKGITGASVVTDEAGVRAAARVLIDRYGQPALVEEYIRGREFTVGLLGDRRPRVLPIMEVIFVNPPDPPCLRLRREAVGHAARPLRVPGEPHARRAAPRREGRSRHVHRARLPGRGAHRPPHGGRRHTLRDRGQPAPRARPQFLGSLRHRECTRAWITTPSSGRSWPARSSGRSRAARRPRPRRPAPARAPRAPSPHPHRPPAPRRCHPRPTSPQRRLHRCCPRPSRDDRDEDKDQARDPSPNRARGKVEVQIQSACRRAGARPPACVRAHLHARLHARRHAPHRGSHEGRGAPSHP